MDHDVGTLRGSSRGQGYPHTRSSLDPHSWHSGACTTPGAQLREPFSSNSNSSSRCECHSRRCWGRHSSYSECRGRRRFGADTFVVGDRMHPPPQTSVFSSMHGDFRQGHTGPPPPIASGCRSHFPNMSKNCEIKSKSLDAAPNADCCCSGHPAPGAVNEIALYGWYLMIPKNGGCTSARKSTPRVAIGGYRTPEMLAGDFIQTVEIEQRLSRSKVRTRDGLEVVLVGMIDLSKSAGSGFSPALVNYFVMGFPPNWIYMILNLGSRTVNCSNSEVWPSPSPSEHPSHDVNVNPGNCTREARTHQPANPVGQDAGTAAATALHGGEPSDMQADRRKNSLNTEASGEMARLLSKAASGMMTNCPPSGQKPGAAEGTASKALDSSSQAQTLDFCGNCHPSTAQNDAAATEMLGHTTALPVENTNPTPNVPALMETSGLAPDHGGCDNVDDVEVPRNSCPRQLADVAKDSLQSGEDSEDGKKIGAIDNTTTVAIATATATATADDLNRSSETVAAGIVTATATNDDLSGSFEAAVAAIATATATAEDLNRRIETHDEFSGNESEASVITTSLQILGTPAQRSEPLTQVNASTDFSVGTVAVVPQREAVGDANVIPNCRKLRSGRQVQIVEELVKKVPVLDATSKDAFCSNKSKNLNKQLTGSEGERNGFSHDCKVMTQKIFSPTYDAAQNLDSLEQVPCTPSQPSRKRSRSVESNLKAPNPAKRRHCTALVLTPLEHSEGRSTRKTECCVRLSKKPKMRKESETSQSPLENGNLRMKLRSSRVTPLAPGPHDLMKESTVGAFVTNCDVKTQSSSAAVKESVEVDGMPEMNGCSDDPVVSSRGMDEKLEESDDGPKRSLKKKRRRKGFYYGNRRKKSEPKSCSPDQSSVSCKADSPQLKPSSARPNGTKDKTPKQRKDGLIVMQSRKKSTESARTSDPTSRTTRQGRKAVQIKKEKTVRNSRIIPPPLPPPRVANKSKVTEAFGLKKSRCGRVIVPPLAIWCNQTIEYDADGSIIAISGGLPLEAECGTGKFCLTAGSNYKFPSSKSARTLQRKLRKAAKINYFEV